MKQAIRVVQSQQIPTYVQNDIYEYIFGRHKIIDVEDVKIYM